MATCAQNRHTEYKHTFRHTHARTTYTHTHAHMQAQSRTSYTLSLSLCTSDTTYMRTHPRPHEHSHTVTPSLPPSPTHPPTHSLYHRRGLQLPEHARQDAPRHALRHHCGGAAQPHRHDAPVCSKLEKHRTSTHTRAYTHAHPLSRIRSLTVYRRRGLTGTA